MPRGGRVRACRAHRVAGNRRSDSAAPLPSMRSGCHEPAQAFRAGGTCRSESAARGAGCARVLAQTISRRASRDRGAVCPRRWQCDRAFASRCEGSIACQCDRWAGPDRTASAGTSRLALVGAIVTSRVARGAVNREWEFLVFSCATRRWTAAYPGVWRPPADPQAHHRSASARG
jgi:hypothetical protein